MADSRNTPLLPKFQQPISRRAVMSTGVAATALAAVPVLAAVPGLDPDAELIAACAAWHENHRRCNEAFKAADAAHDQAEAKEPPVPAELYEALALPRGREAPLYRQPWDPRSLRQWARSGKTFHSENTESDGVLTIVSQHVSLSEATRVRAGELLAIHQRHERAKRRVWVKYNKAQKAADQLCSENWDQIVGIYEMPAFTIAGLHEKMKALSKGGMFENYSGDMKPAAESILKDMARLAAAAVRS